MEVFQLGFGSVHTEMSTGREQRFPKGHTRHSGFPPKTSAGIKVCLTEETSSGINMEQNERM